MHQSEVVLVIITVTRGSPGYDLVMDCVFCQTKPIDWESTGLEQLDHWRIEYGLITGSYPVLAHSSHFDLNAISRTLREFGLPTSTGVGRLGV